MRDTSKNMVDTTGINLSPGLLQIMAFQADLSRRHVDYAFDAPAYYGRHVAPVIRGKVPKGNGAVGAAVRGAILASNSVAGGGAAGYLAIIDLLMTSFREDYFHADELVRRYVLKPE